MIRNDENRTEKATYILQSKPAELILTRAARINDVISLFVL